MALPILGLAAGIAARAAAKKAASRAVGGIAGKGASKVNPVYRMMDKQTSPLSKSIKTNKAEARANKRGLKAANKPVSKNNEFQWGHIGSLSRNRIKNMEPARPNRVRGGSMKSKLNWPKGM